MKINIIFKDFAISKYLRKLSPELKKRYAVDPPYTREQVETAINDLKLDKKYSRYGYAIFCDPNEYKEHGFQIEEIERYKSMVNKPGGSSFGAVFSGDESGGEGACGDGGCGGAS